MDLRANDGGSARPSGAAASICSGVYAAAAVGAPPAVAGAAVPVVARPPTSVSYTHLTLPTILLV
eukprot:558055-Pleurochrysis_carterae.AAC.1